MWSESYKDTKPSWKEHVLQKITQAIHESGFPSGSLVKASACQCRRCSRHRFHPQVGKIPWRKTWQPIPVFLRGESHGQRSLVGYSLWGCKESDKTEQLSTHPMHETGSLKIQNSADGDVIPATTLLWFPLPLSENQSLLAYFLLDHFLCFPINIHRKWISIVS